MAFEKFASDGADDFLPGSIDSPLVGSSPSLKLCADGVSDAGRKPPDGAVSTLRSARHTLQRPEQSAPASLICKSNSGLDRDRIAESPSPGPIRAVVTIPG